MAYITAIEASRRIGVGERTVRLWISQGKLKAEKIAKNRLAIDEREVDRIAKERSKYRDRKQERYESDAYERMNERVNELEKQVNELNKQVILLSGRLAEIERHKVKEKAKDVSVVGAAVSDDGLPSGCIYARDFAAQHGVPESSFRRHISSGVGGDKVDAEKGSKGRYLTPIQQEAALKFWDRHGVKHTS